MSLNRDLFIRHYEKNFPLTLSLAEVTKYAAIRVPKLEREVWMKAFSDSVNCRLAYLQARLPPRSTAPLEEA